MNTVNLIAFALVLAILPVAIFAATSEEAMAKLLSSGVKDVDGISIPDMGEYYRLRTGGIKRDPFSEYGQFRFGKRGPPSFADYGQLRFGKRRGPKSASFADYGHLRFGRSVDEAEIYKHDFDDINDFE